MPGVVAMEAASCGRKRAGRTPGRKRRRWEWGYDDGQAAEHNIDFRVETNANWGT